MAKFDCSATFGAVLRVIKLFLDFGISLTQYFVFTETFIRMSLANYLAKHYLTADSKSEKRSKKRKRKVGTASGLTIADDDALGWDRSIGNADDDAPLEGEISCSSYFHRRLTLLTSNHQ